MLTCRTFPWNFRDSGKSSRWRHSRRWPRLHTGDAGSGPPPTRSSHRWSQAHTCSDRLPRRGRSSCRGYRGLKGIHRRGARSAAPTTPRHRCSGGSCRRPHSVLHAGRARSGRRRAAGSPSPLEARRLWQTAPPAVCASSHGRFQSKRDRGRWLLSCLDTLAGPACCR